jgi:hypothetical protein
VSQDFSPPFILIKQLLLVPIAMARNNFKFFRIFVELLLFLTLNLTAVGGSDRTLFKGLLLKKSLSARNRQKIPFPRKTSAESKSRVMFPSKNVNFCLFYASEQSKVLKKATGCVSHLSRQQHFCPHPGGGLGGSGGWGESH